MNLQEKYFWYLTGLVVEHRTTASFMHEELFRFLDSVPFRFSIPLDENRASDGIKMRYRFGESAGYSAPRIATELDCRDCSVLEMMTGLAVRLEDEVMYNADIGDRTGEWFWNMLGNLNLSYMIDGRFDEQRAQTIIDRFLDRQYAPTGEGGLFYIKNPPRDMASVEIWYQAMWYLNEYK